MKLYHHFFDFFAVIITSGIISYLINNTFVKYRVNIKRDKETHSGVRWGSRKKPVLGGVSFFILFVLSTLFCMLLGKYLSQYTFDLQWIGIITATLLGFFMGLYDDAYHLQPLPKFVGQLLCAAVMIATGSIVKVTNILPIDIFITGFWVVGMMNSINMLDNMDGITGSIAFIAIAGIFIPVFETQGFNTQTFTLTSVMGALLGFLLLNWNPSKLYMGDSGSQFLGAFLSGIAIMYLWRQNHFQGSYGYMANVILPAIIFIVPIIDTTIVTFKRISRGCSPFVGGKDHITHHFVFYALTDKSTAILLASIAALSAVLYNILFFNFIYWKWYLSVSLICYLSVLFGFIFYFYQQGERKKKMTEHNQNLNKTHRHVKSKETAT
ncbi:MAG: undecaprenyl/decaprenyl-phosphate alpha-N-acetylglucosaminyl 1-phosphate transferase [Bacteroidia bacterium]|nr:undecaprenyl/decaprenyl-phosphate alpha-N-acetylglucosaminyl 1-phosphate transferase [Bacteroidia bacterium]MDW8348069.1 MraY family glycosyltransferase [Bacteroidia bacterium]